MTKELLERHLPEDPTELHYFLCVPPPMIIATENVCKSLGVPPDHVRLEVFNRV